MSDFEVQWIEQSANDRARLEELGRELGIHPLAVEDCLNRNQRAKFEDFENHQLLVWFAYIGGEIHELEFIIFPHILILVTSEKPPRGETWRQYLNINRTHRDAYHMLYQALDRATDYSEASVRPLFDNISEFEDLLFEKAADPRALLKLKRELSQAELALAFLSSVAGQWQRFLNPKDDLRWRLRDLWDHCERLHQALIFHRTQIASTMDMYWGFSAKRTNDQIKKLTLVASVAVPLSFWSSFWGMNFVALPFDKAWALPAAIAIMVGTVIAVLVMFKNKGYWKE